VEGERKKERSVFPHHKLISALTGGHVISFGEL
jgi:hypothetical protein